MNIGGVGLELPVIREGEKPSATRSNGKSESTAESRNSFQSVFAKKVDEPKSDKPTIYKKSGPSREPIAGENKSELTVSSDGLSQETKVREEPTPLVEKIDQAQDFYPQMTAEEGAMIKFLYAMKTELGVEPEEVIGAMASLSSEVLIKPPEETMKFVIDQLNLPPMSETRAEELYQVMLKETAEASMGKMLSDNNQTVDIAVVGPEQIKYKNLLKSIDHLNNNFFEKAAKSTDGKPHKVPDSANIRAEVVPQESSPETKIAPISESGQWSVLPTLSKAQPQAPATTSHVSAPKAAVSPKLSPAEAKAIDDVLAQLNIEGFNIESAFSPDAEDVVLPAADRVSPATLETLTSDSKMSEVTSSPVEVLSFNQPADSKDSGASKKEYSEGSKDQFAENLNGAMPVATSQKVEILNSTNSSLPGTPSVRPADQAANTRNLVETAQLLAQNGGGSMKIQLRPEGLGFVELKVGVNSGKVDIQMLAENTETKRLLEGGLSDLKTGLLQHKLTLDSVQVNTNNSAPQNFDGMLGQDRETAREFLEQFREFNQNRREAAYFDFGGANGYGSRSKKLKPEDVQYNGTKAKAARRLDLVA